MRCVACNALLSDYEATRKDLRGQYVDMCNDCFREIQDTIPTITREDLKKTQEIEAEDASLQPDYSEWTDD